MLIDSYRRRIRYLRLSVTDRCNLRCVYCVPESYGVNDHSMGSLRDDEIVRLVSCFTELGVSRVRITGGEPLIRPGIVELVKQLSLVAGISDLSLSTNGLLLERLAGPLKAAGLKRVNVSLDTLEPSRYHEITRYGRIEPVLRGIDAALEADLCPVKINCVVVRGWNDDEIEQFAGLAESRPLHVRFIELMPMGGAGFFTARRWVPLEEIREKAGPMEPLDPAEWPSGSGPARYYRRPGAVGTIGFIGAVSHRFCSECNRVRLSAGGTLVPCLDSSQGIDLLRPMRAGASREEIQRLILGAIEGKPERHLMVERIIRPSLAQPVMCQIGG